MDIKYAPKGRVVILMSLVAMFVPVQLCYYSLRQGASIASPREHVPTVETCNVAIIAACKGRHDPLRVTIDSWLAADGVSRVILVDWSSEPSLESALSSRILNNRKLALIRVDDQPNFILTWAYNLAAKEAAGCKTVFKLDCDAVVTSDFLIHNRLEAGTNFLAGDTRVARDENERHLNGICFVSYADFARVGFYDERIEGYGYDDGNLYSRLESLGLRRGLINFNTIHHLFHTNELRTALTHHYSLNFKFEIAMNRALHANVTPWNSSFSGTTYEEVAKKPIPSSGTSTPSQVHLKTYCINSTVQSLRASASPGKLQKAALVGATRVFNNLDGFRWHSFLESVDASYLGRMADSYYFAHQTPSRRMLIVHLQHGIGSRLRTLASAINLAQGSGRWLRVISPIDRHFNTTLDTIIDLKANPSSLKDVWTEFNAGELLAFPFECYENMTEQHMIDHRSSKHIYVRSAYALNHSFSSSSEDAHIWKSLVPSTDVVSLLAAREGPPKNAY